MSAKIQIANDSGFSAISVESTRRGVFRIGIHDWRDGVGKWIYATMDANQMHSVVEMLNRELKEYEMQPRGKT